MRRTLSGYPTNPTESHVTDYRAEAERVFNHTHSTDTRGVIAALLHLADTLGGGAPGGTVRPGAAPSWTTPVIEYLRSLYGRTKKAYELRDWLADQGTVMEYQELLDGMWALHEQGLVVGTVDGGKPRFAVPSQ